MHNTNLSLVKAAVAALLLVHPPLATRALADEQPAKDAKSLADGNRKFAFSLYQAVARTQPDGNLFLSPYSVTAALGMTWAGARGETERQMAEVLAFELAQSRLHPALGALDAALRRGASAKPDAESSDPTKAPPPVLNTANRLWGGDGEAFLPEFLELVSKNYGAALQRINFGDPGAASKTINDWIAGETADKIKDLLAPDDVAQAALVLTNAVYFKAQWRQAFDAKWTATGEFTQLDGKTQAAPMMKQTASFGHAERAGYQVLELAYGGGTWSMVLLIPDAGRFADVERTLTQAEFDAAIAALNQREIRLVMPKFEARSKFHLNKTLPEMGMRDAFTSAADFSGMDGKKTLFISDVIHEAFVKVDEAGTEAAAATAVVMSRAAARPTTPLELTIDRPFIFAIYDRETATVLFLGRMAEPVAAE